MSADDIVREHFNFQVQLDFKLSDDIAKLPPLHWTPKIHKTPTGCRFIIGSKKSSLKPIGKAITSIFKLIFKYKRRYFRKASFFSGLNHFWPIDNKQDVVDCLQRINSKNRAASIATFDFSTLYTKIPHDKLIEVLSEITDNIFNDTDRKFISVGGRNAYWVKGIGGSKYRYTCAKVKECISFLINNAFFRVGNAIFRQIIGIPMGSDPAPFFANLFLFHYESRWVKINSRNNYAVTKKLFNVFRYIDDLLSLNDNGVFSNVWKEIYPPELMLNKENDSDLSASFLDLEITINNNQFEYKLFDKRRAFPFHIIRFPFQCSNIPKKMFFSTIQAEILRICRVSTHYHPFIDACNPFLSRMSKQGASKVDLKINISKLLLRHSGEFSKYQFPNREIVNSLVINVA